MNHDRFIEALENIHITESEKKMLLLNYFAPNHTITATKMANGMGYSRYNASNLHYGNLAKKIAEYLNIKITSEATEAIVTFKKVNNEWHWTLLQEVVKAIEELDWFNNYPLTYIPEEITPIIEGHTKSITVNAYERNPIARKVCIKHYGYSCQVCGINLKVVYGPVAKDFIHVHHIRPISEIKESYQVDPVRDLVPICPNCHAVIHRKNPPYTIDEIKAILKQNMTNDKLKKE